MEKHLPDNPNLGHLRKQAKDLRRAKPSLKLSEAQHELAQLYGFDSWPKLVHEVERIIVQRQTKLELVARLKSVRSHPRPGHECQLLLSADPQLAYFDLEAACLACDIDALQDCIQRERPDEHHLAILLFSPMTKLHPERAEVGVRLLLDSGASANSRLPDGERYTAAYGAVQIPSLPCLRILLEAGADPNDNECLYHACENDGTEFSRLLLNHGCRVPGTNAINRMADFEKPDGMRMLLETGYSPNHDHSLMHAVHRGRSEAFLRVMLEFGADPDLAGPHGGTARQLAYQRGYSVDLFEGSYEPSAMDRALRACALGEPHSPINLDQEPDAHAGFFALREAAGRGDLAIVQNLLAIGIKDHVPPGASESALHQASWSGHVEVIRLLVASGSDISLRDTRYQGLPIGWAMYSSSTANHTRHPEAVRVLIELGSPSPGFLMGSDAVVEVLEEAFPDLGD